MIVPEKAIYSLRVQNMLENGAVVNSACECFVRDVVGNEYNLHKFRKPNGGHILNSIVLRANRVFRCAIGATGNSGMRVGERESRGRSVRG
jgi:hypothetical protein